LLAGLTLLVLVLSLPGSLRDAFDRGGMYLFSRAFFEDIPRRLTGPGRFRFLMQPVIATLLGIRSGLADARAGRPPYLYRVLFRRDLRGEPMRTGIETVGNPLLRGSLPGAVVQWSMPGGTHPGAAPGGGPGRIGATHRGGGRSVGRPALLHDEARGSAKTWTKQERLTKGDHNS